MPSNKRKHLYRKTSKGISYIYFRAPNGTLTPLPRDENSVEFQRCYDACLKSLTPARPALPKRPIRPRLNERVGFLEGTVGKAVERYLGSTTFAARKESTQSNIRRRADILRDRLGPALLDRSRH